VYPTAEFVRDVLSAKFPGRTKIFGGELPRVSYIIEEAMNPVDMLDPESKLSNTYLMKTFPGIHFNVVCREVHPKCIVAIQRQLSMHQENIHHGYNTYGSGVPNEELSPLLQSLENMQKANYRSFTKKKQRIRNKLLNKANLLNRLSNNQRQGILNTLKASRVLNEQNNTTQAPISKTIKHIVWPKKYPITKGGTRRRTH
jgi:hypothetical protein